MFITQIYYLESVQIVHVTVSIIVHTYNVILLKLLLLSNCIFHLVHSG